MTTGRLTDILLSQHQQLITPVLHAFDDFLDAQEDSGHTRFVEFFELFHSLHDTEEEKLFSFLTKRDQVLAPIKAMRDEVAVLKEHLTMMKSSASEPISFATHARKYHELFTAHLYKENNILYPMIDEHLSEIDHLMLTPTVNPDQLQGLRSRGQSLVSEFAVPQPFSCPRAAQLEAVENSSSKVLVSEHVNIKTMLNLFRKYCKKCSSLNALYDVALAGKFLRFFSEYADDVHHQKEEKILFVTAEQHSFPVKGGPIEVMLLEHDHNRELMQAMKKALANDDVSAFIAAGFEYVQHLTQHIYKEDEILFKLLDSHFNDSIHAQLSKAYEQVDHDRRDSVGELLRLMGEVEGVLGEGEGVTIELSCDGCSKQLECHYRC
ncbi:hypothetical protein P9112_005292 [Eukaryota sp. TZLM1-RC]